MTSQETRSTSTRTSSPHLHLKAQTAGDIMTKSPRTIASGATVREAAIVLIDAGFSALPVVNHEGVPVGVVSNTDITRWVREYTVSTTRDSPKDRRDLAQFAERGHALHVAELDSPTIDSIMTPVMRCVFPDTNLFDVVREIAGQRIHRVFVVDRPSGAVVGVVSTYDIVRNLRE